MQLETYVFIDHLSNRTYIFPKDRIYFFVDEAPTIEEMFDILHSNHLWIPKYHNWHREIHHTDVPRVRIIIVNERAMIGKRHANPHARIRVFFSSNCIADIINWPVAQTKNDRADRQQFERKSRKIEERCLHRHEDRLKSDSVSLATRRNVANMGKHICGFVLLHKRERERERERDKERVECLLCQLRATNCALPRRYSENTFCNNCCCQSCHRFERKHSSFTKMKKYIACGN